MSKLGHLLCYIAADRTGKDMSCVTRQSEKKRLWSKEKKKHREVGGALSEGCPLPDINKRSGRRGGKGGVAMINGEDEMVHFFLLICAPFRKGW